MLEISFFTIAFFFLLSFFSLLISDFFLFCHSIQFYLCISTISAISRFFLSCFCTVNIWGDSHWHLNLLSLSFFLHFASRHSLRGLVYFCVYVYKLIPTLFILFGSSFHLNLLLCVCVPYIRGHIIRRLIFA